MANVQQVIISKQPSSLELLDSSSFIHTFKVKRCFIYIEEMWRNSVFMSLSAVPHPVPVVLRYHGDSGSSLFHV